MGKANPLSTVVDNKKDKARSPRIPAAQTRERILAAARIAFSQAGFDQVGVRELAQASQVDPAIIIRLFGSKEALFATIANEAFVLEASPDEPVEDFIRRLAEHLTEELKDRPPGDFDEFHFLLRSAASPIAAPILSAALHAGFIEPLALHLGGKEANAKAALLSACILGFATLRVALGSKDLDEKITNRLEAVLKACLIEP